MEIQKIEDSRIPKGSVTLAGFGRLGLRIGINLIQVHRGGPKTIKVFDGQKISQSDIIFLLYGAKPKQYKTDFLKQICTHDPSFRNIESIPEDITDENINQIDTDVVAIQIAGGDTISTTAKIIKHAHKQGAKTIGTAGVFGYDETITVKDISQFKENENPIVDLLKKEGINKNHTIVTTNKAIRDNVPILPYTLDDLATSMTKEIIKALK